MSGHNVMMTKHGSSSKTARRPSSEEIEKRAYELFLMRGAYHGGDVEDWLQAERELESRAN